ncbi:thiamine pyrophosphate-binding protein [Primorskyibacter flagellatus]|uniref:Acetolactate synthase-1/2/3 large subunit n=1 Tax=Primorskyibacter flagellatus TaxID=1387277 RepID=A0A1W2BZI3_9RHOB|nr:thiamine pyrophosphate-binding protein [Primorskyibacter flagellatus]SMC78261.1 acetolactate synthase-1/2/3 large subunit [Primorskyibacter flagellatus]
MKRHGGQILTDQLVKLGVERVFSVPGESFLAALDGLHDSGIQNVVCRHEGGASMMAEAHGKLTGRPGVAFVTRGPGATNASAGIHVARQDSTPMVLFVGQIARGHRDREAFQEVDYRAMFGSLAKWVAEIDETARIPEYVARAFRVANSGRPGPVVLALPEDMLSASAEVPDFSGTGAAIGRPAHEDVQALLDKLHRAERPLVVAGGPGWSASAALNLARFAETQNIPVAVSFRRQGHLDNRHAFYVGDLGVGANPKLSQRVRDSDCLLLLGTRFGDIETAGYTLPDPADTNKSLLHVLPDPDEIGAVYGVEASLACAAPAALEVLAELPGNQGWPEWTASARADYEAWREPQETPGAVKLEQVLRWMSDTLPDDAIITNGAGNYAAFIHRYYQFRQYDAQLAPTSGSMGYGFPAAIAAKLQHPDRVVVCLAGDGCFQMTLNEMSTARQHGAAVITIVVNNGRYGTIRMHQEKTYPGRVSGTEMANPDFAALARAYGGHGERVETTEAFGEAFARARASGLPSVIEVVTDPEMLSTTMTVSQFRALGEKAKG